MTKHCQFCFDVIEPSLLEISVLGKQHLVKVTTKNPCVDMELIDAPTAFGCSISCRSGHARFLAVRFDQCWKFNQDFQRDYPNLYHALETYDFRTAELCEEDLDIIEKVGIFSRAEIKEFTTWQEYRLHCRLNGAPVPHARNHVYDPGLVISIKSGDVIDCDVMVDHGSY